MGSSTAFGIPLRPAARSQMSLRKISEAIRDVIVEQWERWLRDTPYVLEERMSHRGASALFDT
jgi:hypothetical protein